MAAFVGPARRLDVEEGIENIFPLSFSFLLTGAFSLLWPPAEQQSARSRPVSRVCLPHSILLPLLLSLGSFLVLGRHQPAEVEILL